MQKTITGENLEDLFGSKTWRDHFTALSDILGFTLSIYTQTGKPIFISPGAAPLCQEFRSSSPNFASRCESVCRSFIMSVLATGKPKIFKCHAKIMCFALPVEYMHEKAAILGQGSFSSYDDFRDGMNLLNAYGIDRVTIKTPLIFTNPQQTWKSCRFTASTVSRLLKNTQENITLRMKFDSLKNIIGMWSAAVGELPETQYRDLVLQISSLLDIDRIAILVYDRNSGKYISLSAPRNTGWPAEVVTLNADDVVVHDLVGGRAFVQSTRPDNEQGPASSSDAAIFYFFPIMISKQLTGIVRIAGKELSESDIQIITAFCRQTSLSVENHLLHQDLYRKYDQFAVISELTKSITTIQDFETLLRAILDMSAGLLKAEQGSLMLLDRETDELLLEVKKGIVGGVKEKLRISRGEGIAGKVAELGEAMLVRDLEDDPRIRQKNRHHYKTHSFVSVPLKIDDRIIGVINLADKTTGEVFNQEDLKLIQSFATHAAIVLDRNVFINKTEELKKLTITDPLTGLLNRRYLHERLKDELSRSERRAHPLSLLMLDIDGFKACNDSFGHPFGDKVLKKIADTLLNTVRSMDIVSRYGGDEFIVILPETAESLAVDIAERIRLNVVDKVSPPRDAMDAAPSMLTVSIGIVCYPEHGKTVEALLEHVDKALYRAKNAGKNRIEVFS